MSKRIDSDLLVYASLANHPARLISKGTFFMTMRHKNSTATFEQLDYHDQARSINQAIINLERMIRATVRKAAGQGRNVQQVLNVKRGQVQRLLHRI